MSVSIPEPVVIVVGFAAALACAAAALAALSWDPRSGWGSVRGRSRAVEHERDLAAALGMRWRLWLAVRGLTVLLALALGIVVGIWSLEIILLSLAIFGTRFAIAGRAAKRRLHLERAFLAEMRALRDRMAVGNQSLDVALQELGRSAPPDLRRILQPFTSARSTAENIVSCAQLARSPIVEQACGILLWARTRSLDALIDAIDNVLVPVSEAQLALEEESLVTLTQQRAVTMAMALLMAFMFAALVRVDSFRAYYSAPSGTIVLFVALAIFFGLVTVLVRIVRVDPWTRWDVAAMADQERAVRA